MAKGNKDKAKDVERRQRSGKKPATLAERADRHTLYQKSVQCVEAECDMVEDTFRSLRGRRARLIREDFCGTANTACEWVRRHRSNRAIGVDLDAAVLAWGRKKNVGRLKKPAAERIVLLQADVLKVETEPVDMVLAMNFSYQLFKERALLRTYFERVRSGLVEDGVFFLDAFGGYESCRAISEKTKHKNFTYIWDQASYNPINGDMMCHIHFAFPDGSRLRRAFTYNWRLWTLPELRDLLLDAGFANVTVYWEGADEKTGEGNGIYTPATHVEQDPSWVCYLSAEK